MRNNANLRKCCALLIAVIAYFVIHEGAHVLAAIFFGSFERVRLLGLGVQVVTNAELMSDWQTGIFCLVGSIATLTVAYLLLSATKNIVRLSGKLIKAVGYYTTLALLLTDPIYLTILYKFVGGGDMNGIKLLGLPELALQIFFGLVTLFNVLLFIRRVYPAYKKAFA